MWIVDQQEISLGVTKYQIRQNGVYLSFTAWIKLLQEDEAFVLFFIELLRNSQYEAYFWEVKPIRQNLKSVDFEFILVESKLLSKLRADSSPFKQYFEQDKAVVTFPNLRADAQLIVPTKKGASRDYTHLAQFVRSAPPSQVIRFWQKVAEEYEKLIGAETKWLSTAGLGVYWLHVRIDSKPKYYRYGPYKSVSQ